MTIAELEAQMATLAAQIEKEKGKIAAREAVDALIAKLGYTFEDLFVNGEKVAKEKGERKKFTRQPAMYKNPTNLRQSWVGPANGSEKPQWVLDFEAAGGDLEATRVKGM
jgi:hypothetical protein